MIKKSCKSESGFNLIEIVIVIAIIIILTAVVVTGFFAFNKSSDLNNNVQSFVNVLRLAQNKTLVAENNSQYGVYINTAVTPNQYILFKGNVYAGHDNSFDQINYLTNTVEFYNVSIGGGSEIIFDKLTGASEESGSVSIRLKSDHSQNKTVYIASSGAVSYSPPAGALDTNRVTDNRHVEFQYNRTINTSTENITLTFDNNQTVTVPISSYLKNGQILWQSTTLVGGSNQVVEVDTIRLNSSNTLFSIFRDRRYNNKSLDVTLSGDSTGYLVHYSADGMTTNHLSTYVSNFSPQ